MLRDFTSLDPQEEQSFLVYEQRMQRDSKKALNVGLIVGGIFGLLVLIIYFSGEKPESRFAETADEDTAELGEERKKSRAAKPDPAPAEEAAKEEAAAEEAAADDSGDGEEGAGEAAPAEGGVQAPPPPKGATKAPPTALTQ